MPGQYLPNDNNITSFDQMLARAQADMRETIEEGRQLVLPGSDDTAQPNPEHTSGDDNGQPDQQHASGDDGGAGNSGDDF